MNGFKNIPKKRVPRESEQVFTLWGEDISIQEKQVDLIKSMVILKAAFFAFSPFFVAVDGWRTLVKSAVWKYVQIIENCRKILVGKIPICHKLAFNIFAQWQNARLNKQAAYEEAGFDVERDKIQSLDKNNSFFFMINVYGKEFAERKRKSCL